nr:MAG TPA: hypothetical protein [Caudoviricetes sp.]
MVYYYKLKEKTLSIHHGQTRLSFKNNLFTYELTPNIFVPLWHKC